VLRLYKLVLLLYPSAHRQEFAEEMLSVFRQVHPQVPQKLQVLGMTTGRPNGPTYGVMSVYAND
jgi:hypothetical protein